MTESRVTIQRDGHVLLIGLNRASKQNMFDFAMLQELAAAYGLLDADADLRCGLLFGHGADFTSGLELEDIASRLDASGLHFVPEDGIDPWQVGGVQLTKPVVAAVQGMCITLGVELALVSDIVVADETARFAQLEASRGALPFGGSTFRFPRRAGWGNAMRWILTGDKFDAEEAYRIGLAQEVVAPGLAYSRALELAKRVAENAPLAVKAVLANARKALRDSEAAAEADLQGELVRLAKTEDIRIATAAFKAGGSPFNDGVVPPFVGR